MNKPLTVRVSSETEQTAELIRGVISKDKNKSKTEKLLLIDSLEQSLSLIPQNEWRSIVDETFRVLLIECEERDCEVIFRAQELLTKLQMNPMQPGGIIYEVFNLENAARRRRELLADPRSHLEWIHVDGGEFWMGEDHYMFNEAPARLLNVDEFWISKHPVINHIAARFPFIELTLAHVDTSCPVVGLNWYEATYFALWIGCRLPREAEWEYAARGGTNAQRTPYFFGSDPEQLAYYAWFNEPNRDHPHAVDELNPLTGNENLNPLGIANILGNVWEWCEDIYSNYEPLDRGTSVADYHSQAMMSGEKVLRGGTFRGAGHNARCGRRVFSHPSNRGSVVGFRLIYDKAIGAS
jgi:formylglycine-generating enzyme required for sulfatase activity